MSTTEWIEDAVGNIDDRFILEALEYRPGKRTKKIVTACVAAAAAVCVIVGLAAWGGSNPGNNQQIAVEPDVDTEAGSETADSTETVFAEAEEGTSFPEISVTQIRQVVNGQGMLAYSLLYFNDLMYTSAATD
ncbi:MAG: hypothetical protein LUI02_07420, partial [Clostridiales bacterium]|nr:hypothetical protein [Clostridiales bacterium]